MIVLGKHESNLVAVEHSHSQKCFHTFMFIDSETRCLQYPMNNTWRMNAIRSVFHKACFFANKRVVQNENIKAGKPFFFPLIYTHYFVQYQLLATNSYLTIVKKLELGTGRFTRTRDLLIW